MFIKEGKFRVSFSNYSERYYRKYFRKQNETEELKRILKEEFPAYWNSIFE